MGEIYFNFSIHIKKILRFFNKFMKGIHVRKFRNAALNSDFEILLLKGSFS